MGEAPFDAVARFLMRQGRDVVAAFVRYVEIAVVDAVAAPVVVVVVVAARAAGVAVAIAVVWWGTIGAGFAKVVAIDPAGVLGLVARSLLLRVVR